MKAICSKQVAEKMRLRYNQALFRAANPGYFVGMYHKRKARDPEGYASAMRQNLLRLLYGTTHEHYLELFKIQRGRCAICHTNKTGRAKHLCIDHDHKTKKIRGLLCQTCNRALGMFKDNLKVLKAAITYLESAQ